MRTPMLLALLISTALVGFARADNSGDTTTITVTSKIVVDKSMEAEALEEARVDGKAMANKYTSQRGTRSVEVTVDSDSAVRCDQCSGKPKDDARCACGKPKPKSENAEADKCCGKPKPKSGEEADRCACGKPKPAANMNNEEADRCCGKPKPKGESTEADKCCGKPKPKSEGTEADRCACGKPKPKGEEVDKGCCSSCSKPSCSSCSSCSSCCKTTTTEEVKSCSCGKPSCSSCSSCCK